MRGKRNYRISSGITRGCHFEKDARKMIGLTFNRLQGLIALCDRFIAGGGSERDKAEVAAIKEELERYSPYRIRFIVNKAKEREVMDAVDNATDIANRYVSLPGFTDVNGLDAIRSEAIQAADRLNEIHSVLYSECMVAEDELKAIRYRVAKELKDSGECKTVADVERYSRADTRVERAAEDYKALSRLSLLVRGKRETLDRVIQGCVQKIAVGRVGMVRDSYTADVQLANGNT